jgi:hypothetical protein
MLGSACISPDIYKRGLLACCGARRRAACSLLDLCELDVYKPPEFLGLRGRLPSGFRIGFHQPPEKFRIELRPQHVLARLFRLFEPLRGADRAEQIDSLVRRDLVGEERRNDDRRSCLTIGFRLDPKDGRSAVSARRQNAPPQLASRRGRRTAPARRDGGISVRGKTPWGILVSCATLTRPPQSAGALDRRSVRRAAPRSAAIAPMPTAGTILSRWSMSRPSESEHAPESFDWPMFLSANRYPLRRFRLALRGSAKLEELLQPPGTTRSNNLRFHSISLLTPTDNARMLHWCCP